MPSKTKRALTIALLSSIINPLLAMDPPTQFIQAFPKDHSIFIPEDQSLYSSLTASFAHSAGMAYLTALLQKRDKICEDILNPIFTQMLESRRIQLWKYLKSQYDIESTLYQESLVSLRFYWKDEEIKISEIMGTGFNWEEAFKGPFSYLNIDRSRITSDQISSLATNNTLTRLCWNLIGLTPDVIKDLARALKKNETLTSLELGCVGIGQLSVKCLAGLLKTNCTLKILNLWGNRIDGEGAKYLAEALKENQTLVSLSLRGNAIGDAGAKDMAESLRINHTLTSLDLSDNAIGGDEKKILLEFKERIRL